MDAVSSSSETPSENSGAARAIFYGGLLAGILDLAAAVLGNYLRAGTSPKVVAQSIASGLLGAASFTGGAPAAAVGVLLHFIIAFGWTIIFYTASRRIKSLTAQPVLSGALHGIAVYALMYYLIVPLSAAPFTMARDFGSTMRDVLIHVFCVGLPIALAVRRFSK